MHNILYRVMVSRDEKMLHTDRRDLQVYLGMTLSAEIKTPKYRIINSFLRVVPDVLKRGVAEKVSC